MGNVVWRMAVTIILLLAVALAGPRKAQSSWTREAAQLQGARYLSAMKAGDGSTARLPWCPPHGAATPGTTPRVLDLEWLGGSPLTRQNTAPGARVVRLHLWEEGHYILYLALPGSGGAACDWAVLDVQRQIDTHLAQVPR